MKQFQSYKVVYYFEDDNPISVREPILGPLLPPGKSSHPNMPPYVPCEGYHPVPRSALLVLSEVLS